jgi:rubredoxin
METVKAKYLDCYVIEYMIYESKCPKCGAAGEHHIEKDAAFFRKQMKCHKCKYEFITESE